MLLYSRKKVRYRRDGYCWKKRKDGKTTREDHMKLKVQGTEVIFAFPTTLISLPFWTVVPGLLPAPLPHLWYSKIPTLQPSPATDYFMFELSVKQKN
jgi:hypothetical protein